MSQPPSFRTTRAVLPRRAAWIAVVALACNCLGCALGGSDGWRFAGRWKLPGWGGDSAGADSGPQTPGRLVATWTDTVRHRAGARPERGFGGRLVFFADRDSEPVKVEGQLVVYAFDETDRPPHETAPTRRFVFPATQFARHESQSQLGTTYSVWLPWDEVGGTSRKISLIARFEPQGGPVVLSEQTNHYLPGVEAIPQETLVAKPLPSAKTTHTPAHSGPATAGVRTANYDTPDGSEGSEGSTSRAMTIRLSPGQADRMSRAKR